MEMLLLSRVLRHKTIISNVLFKKNLLVTTITLLFSSLSFATVPINDGELANSYLNNLDSMPQIAAVQLMESEELIKQIEETKLKTASSLDSNELSNLDNVVKKSLPLVAKPISNNSEPSKVLTVIEKISAVVKAKNISNSIVTIDNADRKVISINTDPLFAFNILNEIALYETDSDMYMWNGKSGQTYDLSNSNGLYYDSRTGSYELSNIRGNVQIYVEPYYDDRGRWFRRANYVF